MSVRATSWAWQQHDLPTGVKFTLVALGDEADDDGVVWIGIKNVAGKVDKSRSAVMRHVRFFELVGLLKISTQYNLDGQQTNNLYRLQLQVFYATEGGSQNDQGGYQNDTPGYQNDTPSPPPSPDLSLNDPDPDEREGEDGWFEILTSIGRPSDKRVTTDRFTSCVAWLDQQRITDDLAYATAIDLKAKWGANNWPYFDVWATFQKWCRVAKPASAGRYY